MEEATYLACVAVSVETIWRLGRCDSSQYLLSRAGLMSPSMAFAVSFLLCIATILLDVKSIGFFKQTAVRDAISLLHASDGVSALILGIGLYGKYWLLTVLGILCLSKFFLLHMLSRMVTGVKTTTAFQMCIQTTKTFVHHLGSFMFVTNPKVILITTIWRCISMNGHAILALKEDLDRKVFELWLWRVSYLRNIMVSVVLLVCFVNENIRRGFAISAVGHVAYMLVRIGPVFRLGSHYLHNEIDKRRWALLTDGERLAELIYEQKYPYLSLELGLLLLASVYFLYLRLIVQPTVDEATCMFS